MKKTQKVFRGNIHAPIIDLDIFTVQLEGVVSIIEHAARQDVSGIASNIVCEHEDNLRIRDAKMFYGSIKR